MKSYHEYDFGTMTELTVRVVSKRVGRVGMCGHDGYEDPSIAPPARHDLAPEVSG